MLLPNGQYILRDPEMTTVFYSRPTAITTATQNSKVARLILTPRTAIRRDPQNTFLIQLLRISEYLKTTILTLLSEVCFQITYLF